MLSINNFGILIAVTLATSLMVQGREPLLERRWTKRDAQINADCDDSKLVIDMTPTGTHIKIVTDKGDTLMESDDSSTEYQQLDPLITRTNLLFFPEPGYVLQGNDSHFMVIKRTYENGVVTALVDRHNETILSLGGDNLTGLKKSEARCTHLRGFKVVIAPNMDANHQDGYNLTGLLWASALGQTDVAKSLVEKGADVNKAGNKGFTALMAATISGQDSIVEYLLNHGAKVDKRSGRLGLTALHLAAHKGRLNITRLLIQHGAPVDIKDIGDDGTPLHFAAAEGFTDVVKELVSKGADINQKIKTGKAPIHMAIMIGNTDLIHYLLQAGVDVNTRDGDNATPLIVALKFSHNEDLTLKIVEHLLHHHKPDVNAKDDNGNTALSLATSKGYPKIESLLKTHGAV